MKRCTVISGSYGLGAGIREPANGPKALRDAGLIQRLQDLGVVVTDAGDVAEPFVDSPGENPRLRYLKQAVEFSASFGPRVESAWRSDDLVLVLGGDHSISISSIAYAARAVKAKHGPNAELGVLWVDAHGDVNTPETTPSGNIHGMSLAALLGYGAPELTAIGGIGAKIKPENVAFIGCRDLDPGERRFIKDRKLACYTMHEIDRYGIGDVCQRALDTVSKNTAAFVISFDFDSCDPSFAPAVGTSVRGGLTLREAFLIFELAAQRPNLRGVELIEYAPERDIEDKTAELGISLAEAALGDGVLA
jgi:arginase